MELKDHKDIMKDEGQTPPTSHKEGENVSKDALWLENKRLLAEVNKLREEAKALQERLKRANKTNRDYEALFSAVSSHKMVTDCDEQTVARMSMAGWSPIHMSTSPRPGYINSAFPARVGVLSPVVTTVIFHREEQTPPPSPLPVHKEGEDMPDDQPATDDPTGEGNEDEVPNKTEEIPMPAAKMIVDSLPVNMSVVGLHGEPVNERRAIFDEAVALMKKRRNDPEYMERFYKVHGGPYYAG